jgi:flagellar biogenesis protein FliO
MLAASGIVDLFVRMVVSLALVLAIVAVAYFAMRRRAGLAGRVNTRLAGRVNTRLAGRRGTARPARGDRSQRSQRGASRRGARQHVEVLGRVGLTRASSAVVLKFADRVLLVGASETAQPTVLAELDAATWELYDQDVEWTVPVELDAEQHDDAATGAAARPGFLEALREATVRRA